MKQRIQKLLGALWLCLCPALAEPAAAQAAPDHQQAIVFDGATIVTMDAAQVIPNGRLVVHGDRITAIGPQATVPEAQNALRIDARGKVLFPGLTEMHGHLPQGGPQAEDTSETLFLYLAGGVTTVRGMLGHTSQFDTRKAIKNGVLAGPTLYLAAPSLNGNSVTSPDHARRKVRQYQKEGWDLLKIHPGLTMAEFEAIADEAARVGMPFGGHVPSAVGTSRALELGMISIDHLDGYIPWLAGQKGPIDATALSAAVSKTREAGTWIVPTQLLFNLIRSGADLPSLQARSENRYMAPATLKVWAARTRQANVGANPLIAENRQHILKALADGGANIALGSDAPQIFSVPGFSLYREIEVMAAAGLSADQILTAGTTNPGRYFGDKDQFGRLMVGSRADILVLSADPHEDLGALQRPEGVMAAGRWYDRATIDTALEAIAARHAPLSHAP